MPEDGKIFAAMLDFFKNDEWNFQQVDKMPVLSMPFVGSSGRWLCYAQAREEQEQFVFYSVYLVNVPPERMVAATEYITRANYGMIIGNFELDYSDGEVRYKTSIAVDSLGLRAELVRNMVYANVLVTDRYLSGLMRIIYGDADPAHEIHLVEDNDEEDDILPDTEIDTGDEDDSGVNTELLAHIEQLLEDMDNGTYVDPFGDDDDEEDEDNNDNQTIAKNDT